MIANATWILSLWTGWLGNVVHYCFVSVCQCVGNKELMTENDSLYVKFSSFEPGLTSCIYVVVFTLTYRTSTPSISMCRHTEVEYLGKCKKLVQQLEDECDKAFHEKTNLQKDLCTAENEVASLQSDNRRLEVRSERNTCALLVEVSGHFDVSLLDVVSLFGMA